MTQAGTSGARVVASALTVATVSALPVFLTAALSVSIQSESGLTSGSFGLALGVYFAAAALTSTRLGRVAERIGPASAQRRSALLAACALGAVAVGGRSWSTLAGPLAVAGIASALANPAANAALAGGVARNRQGLVFGLKQTSVPLATLLGGAAIPALALTVGWRWAYVGAAVVALGAVALPAASSPVARGEPEEHRRVVSPGLVALSVGGGLGAGTAVALGGFVVESSVASGMTEAAAGVLLMAGSVGALAARVILGWVADARMHRPLRAVAISMAVGAVGYTALAFGGERLRTVGVLIAFIAGWGWNGLFHLAVVLDHPAAPAAATGVTQTGFFIGAALGPPWFGLVVERSSFRVAWIGLAVLVLAAAGAVESGRRMVAGR